jgi:hypothetical protein
VVAEPLARDYAEQSAQAEAHAAGAGPSPFRAACEVPLAMGRRDIQTPLCIFCMNNHE